LPQFSNCVLEVVCEAGHEADFRCDDCDLGLDAGSITVTYFDDQGPLVFGGHETSPGCFELVCRSRPRVASLERCEANAFEGSWEEGEAHGCWRIVLPSGPVG
jgi:hypothetical protein